VPPWLEVIADAGEEGGDLLDPVGSTVERGPGLMVPNLNRELLQARRGDASEISAAVTPARAR